MSGEDLVRPSRDGDQFHYHWAARQCLQLLPGTADLVAVTIEGPSAEDTARDEQPDENDELIDVGLYYGDERPESARLIRYIQLKHSTRRSNEAWTASGLKKTIAGFATRYSDLVRRLTANDVAERFRFEFTTNRPIDDDVLEALEDVASESVARHPQTQATLVRYTGLDATAAAQFFRLFSTEGAVNDLWAQRNLLSQDVSSYLPQPDSDAPIQLKELVTRKATTEFGSDPSIRRQDVLRALKTTEEGLAPARSYIPSASDTLHREQEADVLSMLLSCQKPIILHAESGVGKSVFVARLAASIPPGSEAVVYDCFGNGLYRNSLDLRHRHRDGLVQIANELAARGLCHPLIPAAHADAKQYMRAFVWRLEQTVGLLRAGKSDARLCVFIDAADNAQMAAEERREAPSFVRDLLRTRMPEGVQLLLTCRTHRQARLEAPPEVDAIALRPFGQGESATHLRRTYPGATDTECSEFAALTSFNPRVQALALSWKLPLNEMLHRLGPEPTTVERGMESALDRLIEQSDQIEALQIRRICQGLAALRPLVPVSVLAELSETSDSAVRTFALDFGRPLVLKGNSLHFLDEPTETWFRERFPCDASTLDAFLERLRPLTRRSSYAAAAFPQLLLQAGRLNELVQLALSGESLPDDNPLDKRDVELQRLLFALKACLQHGLPVPAAKLALKAAGELAGEERQNRVLQENTDLAALLMSPDRIVEVVARRVFGSAWLGSHHVYNAGLLSGREEFAAEASSHLRMARDWLAAWSRRPPNERHREQVTTSDIAELAIVLLRLRGAEAAAAFLRGWKPRHVAFRAGRIVGRRLLDTCRYRQLAGLAVASGSDLWLTLGLAVETRSTGYKFPVQSVERSLRLLRSSHVRLAELQSWDEEWAVLDAVSALIEVALQVLPHKLGEWGEILRRYLPEEPPSTLASEFAFEPSRPILIRAYALERGLRGERLDLRDIAPPNIRTEMDRTQHSYSHDVHTFQTHCGALLAWACLSAEVCCGRRPADLTGEIAAAAKGTSEALSRSYRAGNRLRQVAVLEGFRVLRLLGTAGTRELVAFRAAFDSQDEPLSPDTLIALCRSAARADGFESVAIDFAAAAYAALEKSRETAESRADAYVRLSRAIMSVSSAEARAFFPSVPTSLKPLSPRIYCRGRATTAA